MASKAIVKSDRSRKERDRDRGRETGREREKERERKEKVHLTSKHQTVLKTHCQCAIQKIIITFPHRREKVRGRVEESQTDDGERKG